jgi:hypothetical protein
VADPAAKAAHVWTCRQTAQTDTPWSEAVT